MLKTIAIAAALSLSLGATSALAEAGYKLDAAGKCRDAKGAFAAAEKCKQSAPTKCKDAKGKFAKCGTPGATPVK